MDNMVIEVDFKGEINDENVRRFIDDIKDEIDVKPDSNTLNLYISSPGGNVDMAVELYNFLRLLNHKVRTINMSYVNSAAVVVFAAGEERISLTCSSFYVHSVTKKLNGIFTVKDLLREANEMSNNTEKIAKILAKSSNKNKSYWKQLMNKGYMLTAQKAKELGFINDTWEHKYKAI